jgi:hypothetical protein
MTQSSNDTFHAVFIEDQTVQDKPKLKKVLEQLEHEPNSLPTSGTGEQIYSFGGQFYYFNGGALLWAQMYVGLEGLKDRFTKSRENLADGLKIILGK